MKRLAFLLIGGLTLFVSKPIKAQIPNGSFESWDTTDLFIYKVVNPNGWMSNNMYWQYAQNKSAVLPSSDAHSGKLSAQFRVIEDTSEQQQPVYLGTFSGEVLSEHNTSKFPISQSPTSISFWYKVNAQTNQSIMVSIYLFKNGDMLHSEDVLVDSAKSVWTNKTSNLHYTGNVIPDSASISILFGIGENKEPDALLYLDDIAFNGNTSSIEEKGALAFSIFPNPANDFVSVQLAKGTSKTIHASILNLEGKDLASYQFGNEETLRIPIGMLVPGIYLLRVQSENLVATQRLIIK